MGGQEPGETQGGKPRRKKGGSSARRSRRGDRGGPHGASGWRKRAEGEGKRRDEATKVVSKGVNELNSGKAEMEKKEGELRRRKAAEEEAAAVAAAKAAEEAEKELARLKEEEELAKKREDEERHANAKALLEDEHRRENEWKALCEVNSPDAVAKRREALDAVKGQLKSDLKKTSAFTSKVRMLNESQWASITKDMETLNLTRYVSEIADAVSEAKLKTSDVPVALHLCCVMHQRYEDFTQALISNLLVPLREESLRATKGEEEDKEAFRRRRVNLRLLTELHLCGVFEGTTILLRALKRLAGMSRKEQSPPKQEMEESDRCRSIEACPQGMRLNDVNLLVAFARHVAWPMAGLRSQRVQEAAELVEESNEEGGGWGCSNGEHESFAAVLIEAYSRLSSHLEIVHRELGRIEYQAEKDRAMYRTLSEDKEATLDSSRKAYDKLLSNVTALSEAIGKPIPELPDEAAEEEVAGIELWSGEGLSGEGRVGLSNLGPWDDDETRSFYEDLPDLFMSVLPSQLGFTTEEWANLRGEHEHGRLKEDEVAEGALDELERLGKEEGGGGDDLSMVTVGLPAELGLGKLEPLDEVCGEETEEGNEQNEYSPDVQAAAEDGEEDDLEAEDDDGNCIDGSSSNQQLHLLLTEELPQCHNRERSDAISIKFCEMNSKSARKRLITALYNVPRQALYLLPQYARIVATLNQVFKDIATGLVTELRGENRWLLRRRTASNLIESKRKNVMFLSELIKFRMVPPVVAFSMLNTCFQDFAGNNIEMACCLLEGCGRFIYSSKHSKERTVKYLDTLQRLKKARNLEAKYEIMIDNAYYHCRPPVGASARRVKILTPLQLWIRHNLFERLETVGPESVVRTFRRLPWGGIPTAETTVPTENSNSLEEDPSAPQFATADIAEGFVEAQAEGGDICLKPAPPVTSVGNEKKETGIVVEQEEQDHQAVKEVDVEMELKKCFLKVAQKKYTLARLAAQVLQGLHKYYPSLTVRVVDALLEDLIFACEAIGTPRDLQRRLGCARFFSELNNCSLVSDAVVFGTLHRILDIGHVIPPSLFSISLPPPPPPVEDGGGGGGNAIPLSDDPPVFPLAPWVTHDPRAVHPSDSPGDCFRIRIVVQILEACAERLARVNNRGRLVKFLTYFQRYLFCKPGVPPDTEFAVLDLLDELESQSRITAQREESKSLLNTSDLAKRGYRKHTIRGAAAANGQEAQSKAILPIYSTWAEAHSAVEDIEKKEYEEKEARKRRFAAMGKDESENAAVEEEIESQESFDSGDEDEEGDADEVGTTDVMSPLSGDDEEEDNKSDDEQQQLLQDNEQYDNVHVYQDDSIFQKAEADEEFDHLFSKLMTENLNKSNAGVVRSTKASYNMPMPSAVGRIAVTDSKLDQPITGGDGVSFRMIKRGAKGKLEGQTLMVPSETNLAVHQLHVSLRESGEHELIKQRVLAYGNSQSAMEASGSIPQLNNPRLVKEEEIERDSGGGGYLNPSQYVCVPAVMLKGSKGGSSGNCHRRPPKM